RQGGRAGRRRGRQGRQDSDRRQEAGRHRLFLSGDRAVERARQRQDAERGNLRPGGVAAALHRRSEVNKRANDTIYGLVAYLYTKDLGRGMRVSEKLDFGMIGLNRGLVSDPAAPFGGMKQSGIGREGAHEGLKEFLETQYISVSWYSESPAMDVLMPQLGETVAEG